MKRLALKHVGSWMLRAANWSEEAINPLSKCPQGVRWYASDDASGSIPPRLSWRVDGVKEGPVLPLILDWIAQGNKLKRRDVASTITLLKKQGRASQALEILEWLLQEKPFQVSEPDYASWLYFVGKVHGQQKAEEALLQIPKEVHRNKAYESLLEICCDNMNIVEVIHIMKKMKELNIPVRAFCYNLIILLYHKKSQESEIPILLNEMAKDGTTCDLDTYNILIMILSKRYDIAGIERVCHIMRAKDVKPDPVTYMTLASAYLETGYLKRAEAAAKKVERQNFRGMRQRTIDQLMLVYAYLGKSKDVDWVYQHSRKIFVYSSLNTFISAIEAYGEIGCIRLAEQVVEEMVDKKGWHHVKQFNAILGAYIRNGLIEKAESILKKLHASSCQPNGITLNYMLWGYLRTGQTKKVMETLKSALTIELSDEITQTKPWLRTTLAIIDLFAENGDVEHAEAFFQNLEAAKLSHYPNAYNMLLKAYVKAEKRVDEFLARMAVHHAGPDAETYRLLKELDGFSNERICSIVGASVL